jgi:hypothetical protein
VVALASPAFAGDTIQEILAERHKEEAECLKQARQEKGKPADVVDHFQFCLDNSALERDAEAKKDIEADMRGETRDDGR